MESPSPPMESPASGDHKATADYSAVDNRRRRRGSSTSLLVAVAVLAIKAMGFQIWILRCSLLLALDPFRILIEARALLGSAGSRILERQRRLGARLVRGCFWSAFVWLVLVGLLLAAFLAGNLVVRRIAEEPVRLEERLDFDYTKASPEALVALGSHSQFAGRRRLVPANHRLQLAVSLTLPESDHNRRLGNFQVRADFLSGDGQVSGSSTHPCMLRFKSSPIRHLETILKSGFLLVGYSSESQILNLKKMKFTEQIEPTAFVRIVLLQRAEFNEGVGIPEIYAASISLESELPLSKRTIWNWRWTVFVWISTGFFVLELVILVFCRPVILPKTTLSGVSFKELSLRGKYQ